MLGNSENRDESANDLVRLERALAACQDLQDLAINYGIGDIFQDNGGKVLQALIILGLKVSPGREGNDAFDDHGNEYELKTLNVSLGKNRGVTTHHHLNLTILQKYRSVQAWYVSLYEGIVLKEIYRLTPSQLEPVCVKWEARIISENRELNNPKIPIRLVREVGEKVYPAPGLMEIDLPTEGTN